MPVSCSIGRSWIASAARRSVRSGATASRGMGGGKLASRSPLASMPVRGSGSCAAAFGFESYLPGAAFGYPIGGSIRIQQDFDDSMPASGRGVPFGRLDRDGQGGTRQRAGSPSRSSNAKSPAARVNPLTTIPVRPAARDGANGTKAGPRRTVSSTAIAGRHRDAGLSTSSLWRF